VISIRFYEPGDAPALFEAARESTREIHPWLPWCHPDYSLDHANTWITRQIDMRDRGLEYAFAVFDGDRFVGGCGINTIRELHRYANLGYWTRTSAVGKGAATAAVRLLATWAFANTNLIRLEIVVAIGNDGSQRVAEKSGARLEGVLRDRLLLHGKPVDAIMNSIVRSEWPSRA
jgi:RimJ/RimL family protein N-acetyltransferase